MRFIGYSEDCVIEALFDAPDTARLTDLLNETEAIALRNARLHALDDGRIVEVGDLTIGLDELRLVQAADPSPQGERHIATRRWQVRVQSGPYSIVGQLHGAAIAPDPLLTIHRRRRMVPLTDATIRFMYRGQPQALEQAVVIFNRELASSVSRVPFELRRTA